MAEAEQVKDEDELTSDEILKLAQSIKDSSPVQDEKQNVHTFLHSIVVAEDSRKVGNLKDDKEFNELGTPMHTVRGSLEMARISEQIMDNSFFSDWFNAETEETLASSLSRSGFLIKQATTTTKQVADATLRTKINKGWFKKTEEKTGGDITNK